MSRSLSKQQKAILVAIAEENKRTEIVAWCDIDVWYGSAKSVILYNPDLTLEPRNGNAPCPALSTETRDDRTRPLSFPP